MLKEIETGEYIIRAAYIHDYRSSKKQAKESADKLIGVTFEVTEENLTPFENPEDTCGYSYKPFKIGNIIVHASDIERTNIGLSLDYDYQVWCFFFNVCLIVQKIS